MSTTMRRWPAVLADDAAQHGVGVAPRTISAAITVLRVRTSVRAKSGDDALALHELVVELPVVAVARIVLGIDQLEVRAGLDARPRRPMRALDDSRRPIRIGWASLSSTTLCTARSTRSSSPSA